MPNWCNNGITLRHADPAMIERVAKGREGLLMEFLPCPAELTDTMAGSFGDTEKQALLEAQEAENVKKYGYKNWYDWQIANWGTKWDFALENFERPDANTVTAAFDSAWAPPIEAYVKLCALGFIIEALYYEPGMAFCGKFVGDENDYADDYYEFSGHDSTTIREAIGEEIDDYFGISDEMAQWEEENEDE
jgi:Ferredoxin-like domain in Api92-like protein